MKKNIFIIILIQLIFLIIIGFSYIPIQTPVFFVLAIFSLIVKVSIGFVGFVFGIILTFVNYKNKNKNNLKYIYIWLVYIVLLYLTSRFSTYIKDSLEVFNTDRGDVLPYLPVFQQNLGFYLNSLIFSIPLTILILYITNNKSK